MSWSEIKIKLDELFKKKPEMKETQPIDRVILQVGNSSFDLEGEIITFTHRNMPNMKDLPKEKTLEDKLRAMGFELGRKKHGYVSYFKDLDDDSFIDVTSYRNSNTVDVVVANLGMETFRPNDHAGILDAIDRLTKKFENWS
jgi:hypothetical protein